MVRSQWNRLVSRADEQGGHAPKPALEEPGRFAATDAADWWILLLCLVGLVGLLFAAAMILVAL